jgi:hypothetical protein
MKVIKTKIMQIMANSIIYMLENAYNDEMFDYYFELGAKLNAYAIVFHDVYLE